MRIKSGGGKKSGGLGPRFHPHFRRKSPAGTARMNREEAATLMDSWSRMDGASQDMQTATAQQMTLRAAELEAARQAMRETIQKLIGRTLCD
jgi:hypothetical protein